MHRLVEEHRADDSAHHKHEHLQRGLARRGALRCYLQRVPARRGDLARTETQKVRVATEWTKSVSTNVETAFAKITVNEPTSAASSVYTCTDVVPYLRIVWLPSQRY